MNPLIALHGLLRLAALLFCTKLFVAIYLKVCQTVVPYTRAMDRFMDVVWCKLIVT